MCAGVVRVCDRYIVAAHFHCHAPTCLRVELWNNDTGALLCAQEPVYGGTGIIDRDTFDEAGYIATPVRALLFFTHVNDSFRCFVS